MEQHRINRVVGGRRHRGGNELVGHPTQLRDILSREDALPRGAGRRLIRLKRLHTGAARDDKARERLLRHERR